MAEPRRAEALILSIYFLPYAAVPFAVAGLATLAAEAYWDASLAAEFFRRASVLLLALGALKLPPATFVLASSSIRIARAAGLRGAGGEESGGERAAVSDSVVGVAFSLAAIALACAELHASLMAARMAETGDAGAFLRFIGDVEAIAVLAIAAAVLAASLVARIAGKLSLMFTVIAVIEAFAVFTWLDSMAAAVVPVQKSPHAYLLHFILSGFFSFSAGNPAGQVSLMLRAFAGYSFSMAAAGAYLLAHAALVQGREDRAGRRQG